MREPMNVSIVPNSPGSLKNRLFAAESLSGPHAGNGHWIQPMAVFRAEALKEGIILNTFDVLPPAEADVIILMELPVSPRAIRELRRSAPKAKLIFMPIETPLGRKYIFNKANHLEFDAVLTYNPALVDGIKYFQFRLPIPDTSFIVSGSNFSQRKTACMVSTNSRLPFRTGLNILRAGWRFSLSDWLDYVFYPGDLVGAKRSLARAFAEQGGTALDIYGDGWEKPAFPAAKGRFLGSKLELLGEYRFNICYENCLNDCGYISEKIFDALYADTVPVYLGNRAVLKDIPAGCFVDGRKFKNDAELVRFVLGCPEAEWERFRKAGHEFLHSRGIEKFLPKAFAKDLLRAIRAVVWRS